MTQYVITRDPVKYNDGTWSPRFYFKKIGLGILVECTSKPEEAKHYTKKVEANKMAKSLSGNWHTVKLEETN